MENIILLRTPEGELTFTFVGDDRLDTAFSEWEQLKEITPDQHQFILELMNNCEWNRKIEFIDGEIVKVNKYSEEEETEILKERELSARKSFYLSEKTIAMKIIEDFSLELEDISEEETKEVKVYIKEIRPTESGTLNMVTRPKIMYKYDEVMKNGL